MENFGEIKNKIAIQIELNSCMVFVLCLRYALYGMCLVCFHFFSFLFVLICKFENGPGAHWRKYQRYWLFVYSMFFLVLLLLFAGCGTCFFIPLIRCWMTYMNSLSLHTISMSLIAHVIIIFFINFSLLMMKGKKIKTSTFALIYFISNRTQIDAMLRCCSFGFFHKMQIIFSVAQSHGNSQ